MRRKRKSRQSETCNERGLEKTGRARVQSAREVLGTIPAEAGYEGEF